MGDNGRLLVGDKGKILCGFRSENAQLIPEAKMRSYRAAKHLPEPGSREPSGGQQGSGRFGREAAWIKSFKGGPASYGDFLLAQPISDAINLAAISLRLGGRRLLWNSTSSKITNIPEANRYLTREYRPGWEL